MNPRLQIGHALSTWVDHNKSQAQHPPDRICYKTKEEPAVQAPMRMQPQC